MTEQEVADEVKWQEWKLEKALKKVCCLCLYNVCYLIVTIINIQWILDYPDPFVQDNLISLPDN